MNKTPPIGKERPRKWRKGFFKSNVYWKLHKKQTKQTIPTYLGCFSPLRCLHDDLWSMFLVGKYYPLYFLSTFESSYCKILHLDVVFGMKVFSQISWPKNSYFRNKIPIFFILANTQSHPWTRIMDLFSIWQVLSMIFLYFLTRPSL